MHTLIPSDIFHSVIYASILVAVVAAVFSGIAEMRVRRELR